MTFRYMLTTPDGQTHVADSAEEFETLLDRLQEQWPDGEITGDCIVLADADNVRTDDIRKLTEN